MGCFLGCFGGERGDERRERRRRRSAKRLPRTERRNESSRPSELVAGRPRGTRQPSLTQVTPRLSPEKLPLDPAVESAFCELTFPLDQSVELSSEKILPQESAVESVSGEQNLQKEPPVRATDQENPPLHTPVDTAKAEISEIRTNEKKSSSLARKKVTFDLNVKTYEPVEERCYSSDDEIEEQTDAKSQLPLSPITFPSNHRYQNCDSDDEAEELEEEEEEEDYYYSDSDEEEGLDELDEGIELDEIGIRIEGNDEESYESFFSLSIDKERESSNDNTNGEVSSLISKTNPVPTDIPGLHTRDRSQFVHSVLNPVENLSQWKQAKVNLSEKSTNKDKTVNSNLYKENKRDEVSVDTSLSTWLVSTDNSQVEKAQAGSLLFNREDRPILGALTVADIKETSVNSSPRRSPSRSPSHDDVPIIGTVGSYWSCSHSSRFREEKMGKCR